MERLFEKFQSKLASITTTFVRSAFNLLDQDSPLIGIKGQRGVGKTTLLLQYAKLNGRGPGQQLYVSLDDFGFLTTNSSTWQKCFTNEAESYCCSMKFINTQIGHKN